MENHVKTYIKAVKVYCKPLQGEKYQTLERKLKAVAEEIDKKKKTSTEIHTAFSSYEDYLLQNFKEKFERVARDKTYQDSRKHLTPLPLPGETQQLNSDDKKKALYKTNEKKGGEGSKNSTPQPKKSGNGARVKQGEEGVTPPNDLPHIKESEKKLTEKVDELNDLKNQLTNLAKECDIDGGTPQIIITETIRKLKDHRERERKTQDQRKGKMAETEGNLEEVTKLVFDVKKVKNSEHDIEKTKAKIKDLHSKEEELLTLKRAVSNSKKGKDEIHSMDDTMKRVSELQSKEEELLTLKRAVFTPNKGKDEVRSTEDTTKRVSELQSKEEELLKLKRAVFTSNKGNDEIHSTEDTIKRVSELQRSETELLEWRKITFDEELMKAAFGGKQDGIKDTLEIARVMVQKLKSLFKDTEAERRRLLDAVIDKEGPCSVDDALKTLDSLKRAHDELKRLLEAVCDSEDPLTTKAAVNKVQQLKRSVREQNETIQQQKAACEQLEKNVSEMEKKYNSLKRDREDMAQRLDNEIKKLQRERDDLLKRFSEVAGAKLTHDNPNITDLSDPNRPIKIGEQYSELYDNAWTDAFEKLTGESKKSDRESTQILLDILEDSYTTCKEIAGTRYRNILVELTLLKLAIPKDEPSARNTQRDKKTKQNESKDKVTLEEMTAMQKFFDNPTQSVDRKILESVLGKVGLRETDIKYVKNMLKMTLEGTSHLVEQYVWKRQSEKEKGTSDLLKFAKPYLKKCARVCWLMVAQDPPVCLKPSEKNDKKFDKEIYREFTSSGKKIDYVVWPALLLHEGGPLLNKGVAQPKA
ncbi:RB1-inducible coiled-coil protein 1-like isoform X2 [Ostrea edulis]|uniref:RB1-inducible coiled-coil protein 1-like isoform X2 n=1 Tax=Ostrea edulis TaxID=37623 RepID=UPI0024AFA493|nr:RB1-inducible coiled-coil protein 1-like isoform X2 [Ostrea edulis]